MNRIIACVVALCVATSAYARTEIIEFSTGTGFLVASDGMVLTNYHIIRNCKHYEVFTETASSPATLMGYDEEYDLALLKTEFEHYPSAIFNDDPESPQADDKLVILGYPGEAWKTHRAVANTAALLAMFGPLGENYLLQISSAVAKGNSGGPLLDRYGRVIGMITAKATLTQLDGKTHEVEKIRHVDVAVQSHLLIDFLRTLDVEPLTVAMENALPREEIIAEGREVTVNLRCQIN